MNMLNKILTQTNRICNNIICTGLEPLIKIEGNFAYFIDPVLGLNRNRVNAEIYKSIIRLKKKNIKTFDDDIQKKILNWLLSTQNQDGSWNEIHSNYDQPSALLTSFVGEALLLSDQSKKIVDSMEKAKNYVLSKEFYPGYFKKSAQNYADCLNVNATCGAFLAKYAEKYDDEICRDAACRAAHRVCHHQFSNGAFPYTSPIRGYPYKYHHYIPCIHYQGVTLFFLSKIHSVLKEDWILHSLNRGVEWLSSVQKKNGYFDWSKSGLMYAYYLAGSYAFASSSFLYFSKWNEEFIHNAKLSLCILEKNVNDIVNRWEQGSFSSLPKGILDATHTAWMGEYPLSNRFFRFGYGTYKQFARRRYSKKLEDELFKKISSFADIKSTWIEPSKNYPDLFNTSEVLDCLTTSLIDIKECEGSAV